MLEQSNTIRDVSRALPPLVSGSELDYAVSAESLDALATAVTEVYDGLHPLVDRAGHALSEAMQEHDLNEQADPDGEGVRALEQTEAYFKHRRQEIRRVREACANVGAATSHEVFAALDRLDELYLSIVATMQDVRWSLLIADGIRDKADAATRRAFATSSEWLASLDGD